METNKLNELRELNELKDDVICEARRLLTELDLVQKTHKCHKENRSVSAAGVGEILKLRQTTIISKLERWNKISGLSQDEFAECVYAGLNFKKANPIDEKTGKLMSCWIKQNRQNKDYFEKDDAVNCAGVPIY
jgi:hypothetical protein